MYSNYVRWVNIVTVEIFLKPKRSYDEDNQDMQLFR